MKNYSIAVIVGSLRRDSLNMKLAKGIAKLAPDNFSFGIADISQLPFYNQDYDNNIPEPVKKFKDKINASQGILFFTPEYNRSIPGVLKNVLDLGSRPYGQSAWAGKPAGIIGVSIGATGTAMAQQHLRNILSFLDMPTMCQPEAFIQATDTLFDDKGDIGAASGQFLSKWMVRYAEWVKNISR
jgi:chromate reductase, NAD(P)H dehydrogenase (quinone)